MNDNKKNKTSTFRQDSTVKPFLIKATDIHLRLTNICDSMSSSRQMEFQMDGGADGPYMSF